MRIFIFNRKKLAKESSTRPSSASVESECLCHISQPCPVQPHTGGTCIQRPTWQGSLTNSPEPVLCVRRLLCYFVEPNAIPTGLLFLPAQPLLSVMGHSFFQHFILCSWLLDPSPSFGVCAFSCHLHFRSQSSPTSWLPSPQIMVSVKQPHHQGQLVGSYS